jgi:hypothetical protein
MNRFDFVLI